ncbi:MAG: ubiquinol-cytochrome C chaperone family protein, partial [Alphaproteobacteria bacterium]|nr:ubiquinol-cytochrome C chaperone family protein [Alphaproteobacteria bacterium]
FYAALGVPDTVDGRFELLALHMALVLMRLKDQGEEARELSQALFDRMFADMDRNLRDMGVGDLKVGKHVRRMAEALYGRLRAYERGLAAAQDDALAEALRRNLFGTVTGDADAPRNCLADLTTYMRRAAAALDRQPVVEILSGAVAFGPPPGGDGQA